MKAQIAQFLNVQESQILEIKEWAFVFWVKISGRRPTFVSKKVVKVDRKQLLNQLLEEFNSKLSDDQFDCDVNTGMPLTSGGSYKQNNWAAKIRYESVSWWTQVAEEFPELLEQYSDEQLTKVFRETLWNSDSIWWINHREENLALL